MRLTEKIKRILFEDSYNLYGSEYMSHPYEQEDQLTIQPDLPIAPSATANMQLTHTAPPVEDESYVPANNKQLASAWAALAVKVPDEMVSHLYKQVRTATMSAQQQGPTLGQEEEEAATAELESEEPQAPGGYVAERIARLSKKILGEASWADIEFGAEQGEEEEEETPMEIVPDTIKGKYLAQYYRDKPGVDPEKLKKSGESTMVTGTGRLLQNVVRPLIDVPKAQLADAVEYLRLQFRVLTQDMETVPADAPRTFSGLYLKKLVPKLKDSQLGGNFLQTVVTDFKRRDDKWLSNLATAALEEVESEKAAFARLKDRLEKEDPQQAALLQDVL